MSDIVNSPVFTKAALADAAAQVAAIKAEVAASDAYDTFEVLYDLHAAAEYDKYAAEVAVETWSNEAVRVEGSFRRSAWYDETDYIVPSKGIEAWRFERALYDKWATPNTGWSVGGYSTPRARDNGDGNVLVTTVYHIGD